MTRPGTDLPIVAVGLMGSGKTTALSWRVDGRSCEAVLKPI